MAHGHRSYIGGLFLVIIGVILLLDNLEIADFSHVIHTYWPVFLVLIGVNLLLRRSESHWHEWRHDSGDHTSPPQDTHSFDSSYKSSPNDKIFDSAVFGDLHVNVISKNFQGGDVRAVFGEIEVDMGTAELAPGEHTLRVHTVFGSTRLYVPRNIGVMVTADSTFGDVRIFDQVRDGVFHKAEFKSDGYDSAERKLKIFISQVFGDVKVR